MKTPNWPWNLYEIIFGKSITEADLSVDHYEALEYVLTHTMPERDAKMLRLRYQEDLTYREIGEIMGITANGARYNIINSFSRMRSPKRIRYLRYGMAVGSNSMPPNTPLEKTGIENLDIPRFVYNCLKRASIDTVEQLIGKSEEEMMGIRCFGKGSLEIVQQALAKCGLNLPRE